MEYWIQLFIAFVFGFVFKNMMESVCGSQLVEGLDCPQPDDPVTGTCAKSNKGFIQALRKDLNYTYLGNMDKIDALKMNASRNGADMDQVNNAIDTEPDPTGTIINLILSVQGDPGCKTGLHYGCYYQYPEGDGLCQCIDKDGNLPGHSQIDTQNIQVI